MDLIPFFLQYKCRAEYPWVRLLSAKPEQKMLHYLLRLFLRIPVRNFA